MAGRPKIRQHREAMALERARRPEAVDPLPGTGHLTHGAHSSRVVTPIARQHVKLLLANPDTPGYLRDQSYEAALLAWGVAEAQCDLLRAYRDRLATAEAQLTEQVMTDETTTNDPLTGRGTRSAVTRKIESLSEALRKAEAHAQQCRRDLGLTPLSRARLGADVAQAQRVDLAQLWARMAEQEKEQ